MRPEIRLHIEELVLHGFAAGDRYAIAGAVEQELSALLMNHFAVQGGLSQLNPQTARIDAGSFNVTPAAAPNSIGTQIAQAVHGVLIK
jgi:hypothetical protein